MLWSDCQATLSKKEKKKGLEKDKSAGNDRYHSSMRLHQGREGVTMCNKMESALLIVQSSPRRRAEWNHESLSWGRLSIQGEVGSLNASEGYAAARPGESIRCKERSVAKHDRDF